MRCKINRGNRLNARLQMRCCSVQDTDGSFFESFTALSWKQENRRHAVLQEVEARAEEPPPPSRDSTLTSQQYRLSKKEVGTIHARSRELLFTLFPFVASYMKFSFQNITIPPDFGEKAPFKIKTLFQFDSVTLARPCPKIQRVQPRLASLFPMSISSYGNIFQRQQRQILSANIRDTDRARDVLNI